jgi:hypothetical protein
VNGVSLWGPRSITFRHQKWRICSAAGIAVGTAVAGGPPRRSVREEFSTGSLFYARSASASGAPLFAGFADTTDPSDFLTTCAWSFPSETLSQRSVLNPLGGTFSPQTSLGFDSLSLTPRGLPSGDSMSAALPFPVLALETSTHAQVLRLRRVRPHLALALRTILPSPCHYKVGTRECGFRSSVAGLRLHSPMLHPERHRSQRRACGQSYWQGFLCKTLSFSVSSRFIPALSLTP